MKDEMPLTDRDFADIRASVMQTIETQRSRRVFLIRAAAAVMAIVAAVHWPEKTPVKTIVQARPPAVVVVSMPPPSPIPRPHHRPRKHHHQPVVAAKEEATPIRLELETADPDIRIIWITNSSESTGETQ